MLVFKTNALGFGALYVIERKISMIPQIIVSSAQIIASSAMTLIASRISCALPNIIRLSQTSYHILTLGGTAIGLVHEILTWNIPSVVRFFLRGMVRFFDYVLTGQNGILPCLLRYNLLGLMFRAPHVFLRHGAVRGF